MPAAPKSPRSTKKAPGPSKSKGAVRAKSGCYTCRIRRKKCDENRTVENGPCGTCSRLKLECLGFGAKRPDWLRDSHKVAQIRDRIKAHLASQGMIKGHSGSGTRNAIHLPTLRLSTFEEDGGVYQSGSGSSSSGSPRHREVSVDSDSSFPMPPHLALANTSAMRGYPHIHNHLHAYPQDYDAAYLTQYPPHMDFHHHTSRFVSPSDCSVNQSYDETMDYTPGLMSNSLQLLESPAIRSSFSGLYHVTNLCFEDDFTFPDNQLTARMYQQPASIVSAQVIDISVRNYVARIVKVQYLLGNGKVLPQMIYAAISEHEICREAVNLLAHTYYNRQQKPTEMVLKNEDISSRVVNLLQLLEFKNSSSLSADDAMAALHIVSLYLFDGGQGAWESFLTCASLYVRHLLRKSCFTFSDALMACNEKDQFIVKTTIWFDVLASITTRQEPRLSDVIGKLFDPRRCHIEPTYNMLDPMGCDNVVIWAMAEASRLSYWKRKHMRQGDLSVVDLVTRTREIDMYLLPKPPQPPLCPPDPAAGARYLASEIFRTSTRLFLQSIVSGDFPHVPEIKRGVRETMACIENLPAGEYESAIVRSTVFGIFVCGALTDDPVQQNVLRLKLQQGKGNESVGNCPTILDVLEELWVKNAMRPKKEPVEWRRVLKERKILLV